MQPAIIELLSDSRLFLAVLLHFIWQATLIVAVIAICRSVIHPRFFQARYLCVVTGLFAVLMAPMITTGYYVVNTDALAALTPPLMESVVGQHRIGGQRHYVRLGWSLVFNQYSPGLMVIACCGLVVGWLVSLCC